MGVSDRRLRDALNRIARGRERPKQDAQGRPT